MCELAPEPAGIHVVDERPPAADLHDRQELTVASLEIGVARDVDDGEREAELGPQLLDDRARAIAQVAALRVVEDDLGRGYG